MKLHVLTLAVAAALAGSGLWLGESRAAGPGGAQLPAPAYDSGWVAIDPSATLTLHHDLATSTDNMLVDLQFKASPLLGLAGVNNQFYGTAAFGPPPNIVGYAGAYWSGLTPDTIFVFREGQDLSAEQVRVRIWLHK
jgi:hypothetical protein